jgi:hypothetical protein
MFEFLKRLVKAEPQVAPPPRRRKSSGKAVDLDSTQPAPLQAEVTEGNDHSDWELWEDSVVSLDSRMQGLMPSTKIYDEPERPSEYQDIDAYSTVRRKDP